MLVVRCDLIEFILERPHPGDAVHELEMALLPIVLAGVIDDGVANRLVHLPRDLERHLCIVEPLGPGILVVHPDHLAWLAQHSPDAIEEDRLAIR
jgi:hypothetical protein